MLDDVSHAARAALDALIAQHREDYAALSRLIGRNPAYIQQFVKRGTPRVLAEADRRTLAAYFQVPETLLGGPADPSPSPASVAVPRYDLAASAGQGALDLAEQRLAAIPFPPAMLRDLGAGDLAALSIVRVAGDSMLPTLADGDDILVDRADAADRLREGVYVLRAEGALLVKRIALQPGGGVSVLSDNKRYRSFPDADRRTLAIVGRVLWAGGRVR